MKLHDEILNATEELRYYYSMRMVEKRKDPWIPAALDTQFSQYAQALVELIGHERANEIMTELVITQLGQAVYKKLREEWMRGEKSWIDMCHWTLQTAGKKVP